jgi:hypothetical protein
MSLQEEYDDFFGGLGAIGTAYYKFITMFRVEVDDASASATINFGKSAIDEELNIEVGKRLRIWLKEQKRWINTEKKAVPATLCKRRMWFFVSKLLEEGIFSGSQQSRIIVWMDICCDRMGEEV